MAMLYLYETHCHTLPTSACARAGLRETLEAYKANGFAGVFLTNHFLDGNIDPAIRNLPYAQRIYRYFDACEEGKRIGEELGLTVFSGIEMSHHGTDFLVYGIDRDWCLAHEDMDKMQKSQLLTLLMESGALVIQAHPFRESRSIDHIRLFLRHVHGVEIFNAGRREFENTLAAQYCENYGLIPFAGTDNHVGGKRVSYGGMATEEPLKTEGEFIALVLSGKAKPFLKNEKGIRML